MPSIQTSTVFVNLFGAVHRASWHSGKCGVKRGSRSARTLVRAVVAGVIAEWTRQQRLTVGLLSSARNGRSSGGKNRGAFDKPDWAYNDPRNRPLGDRSFRGRARAALLRQRARHAEWGQQGEEALGTGVSHEGTRSVRIHCMVVNPVHGYAGHGAEQHADAVNYASGRQLRPEPEFYADSQRDSD